MNGMAERSGQQPHEERTIGTWNGFAVLAIGIALIAVAIWELIHYITLGRAGSVGGLIASVLIFMALMILGVLFLAGLYTVLALHDLSAKQVVALDDERRAAMVSNLMTVLCAESEVQPVINTGTLYNG